MTATTATLPRIDATPETLRLVAAVRIRTDCEIDHVLVPLDLDSVTRLIGPALKMLETDHHVAFVASGEENQPVNAQAMEIADLYGIEQELRGDVLIFGYDGELLRDAPGAALMLGMPAMQAR